MAEASHNRHSGTAEPLTRHNASGMNAMIGATQLVEAIMEIVTNCLNKSKERIDRSMSMDKVYREQPEAAKAATACGSRKPHRLLPWLPNNGVLLIAAVAAISGGFALNWSWLVAVGLAPVIVSLLPCMAICALGLGICKMAGIRATNPKPQIDKNIVESTTNRIDITVLGKRNAS